MRHLIVTGIIALLFGGCARLVVVEQTPAQEPKPAPPITALGYGVESKYKNYPAPQQRLLAIRSAKIDAFRNLAEELHGTRIRSNTTGKDMAIENDSYRAYVDAVVRGARLITVTPKGDGVYEAELELRRTPVASCYGSGANLPVQAAYCALRPVVYSAPNPVVYTAPNPVYQPVVPTCTTGCGGAVYPQAYYFLE